jgi:transposase
MRLRGTGRRIMSANAEKLREALNDEKEAEVRWGLSFISLAAGGVRLEEAAAHFGICIATGYSLIRRWNSEGVEGLARKKIPGRPP